MTLTRFMPPRAALTPRQRRRVEDRIRRWLRHATEGAEFLAWPDDDLAELRRASERAQARSINSRTTAGS